MRTGLSRACAIGMAVAASFMGLSVLLPPSASAAPATVRSSGLAGPSPAGAGTDSPPVSGPKVAGRAGFALKGSTAARNAPPAQVPAPNPASDMTNHGGNIMLSPVIYNVFWLPAGHYESPGSAASDANYENLLNRWAGDVGGNDFYNIVTQYTGANGRPSNSVSLGGSYTDTTAYPHAGTQADPLSDGDIHGAVDRAVTHFSSPRDLNHIYMVYTGLGIEECFSATSCTFEHNPGDGAFCAYHTVFGGPSLYAFMGAAGVSRGCGGATTPNGDAFADNEASVASHELIESATDPQLDAWFFNDTSGEIGDLCNQQFGPRDTTGANLFLGAAPNPYALQMEWSNAVHGCAPDLNSARTSIVPPVLTLVKSAPATAVTGQQINYSMTVTNPSNTDASTLTVVTDTLPSGVTFVAGSASPAPSLISPLTWNLGTLGVHDNKSITFRATSNPQSVNNCGAVNFKDELQIAAQAQVTGCAATIIAKANTTIAVMSSANPSVFGQPVTFAATVAVAAPGAGTASGTVNFFDGATLLGAGTLSGGTTTIAAPASVISSVGTHHITATYSGDGSFLGSMSAVFDQVVTKAPTTTSLTAAPPGSVGFGHPVTFTATVGAAPPGAGSPTGAVVFTVDGT
ncbi:MAG: hypothetical protein QOK39_2431, partial [Acidimicrobiaceae bacterium]|nr:hypothetical protein [Acidimicrobiaceae bacterium]